MKVSIDKDELCPYYSADKWEDCSEFRRTTYPVADIPDHEWQDYKEVMKRFNDWQDKLWDLSKS